VKSSEFSLTENRNGKFARKNKVKGESQYISSGQRELFQYGWRVSLKMI